MDKFGYRLMIIITTTLITVGQIFVQWGVNATSFTIMLVGRIIFALGGEICTVG